MQNCLQPAELIVQVTDVSLSKCRQTFCSYRQSFYSFSQILTCVCVVQLRKNVEQIFEILLLKLGLFVFFSDFKSAAELSRTSDLLQFTSFLQKLTNLKDNLRQHQRRDADSSRLNKLSVCYAPARREGSNKLCFCPSVRLSHTQRIIRQPKGLACPNFEVRFSTADATRILG